LAEAGARDEAHALAAAVDSAEAVTRREAAASWWRRDPRTVGAAWDRVTVQAMRSLRELGQRRRMASARWVALEPQAAAAVEAARREAATPGLGSSAAARAQRATVELATARRRAAEGAFEPAVTAALAAIAESGGVRESWVALHRRFDDRAELVRWNAWAASAIAESRRHGGAAVVVDKLQRRLTLYVGGQPTAELAVELGASGLLPKRHAGDRATPEGLYRVTQRKEGGATLYHRALLLDYPNREDRERFAAARRRGELPPGVGIGSLIEIHGNGGRGNDWTDGCVALEDAAMERLYARVKVGTPVAIVGTLD
jgi:L,D-peptidoglycan transpeptidase YkuD (ErfK/YbiS/YcfS/YnhG family)